MRSADTLFLMLIYKKAYLLIAGTQIVFYGDYFAPYSVRTFWYLTRA